MLEGPFEGGTILASIASRWLLEPGYMHSFAITSHYYILICLHRYLLILLSPLALVYLCRLTSLLYSSRHNPLSLLCFVCPTASHFCTAKTPKSNTSDQKNRQKNLQRYLIWISRSNTFLDAS